MSRNQVATTLVIHACPSGSTQAVGELLSGLEINWLAQPLLVGSVKTEFALKMSAIELEDIVSQLRRVEGIYLDCMQQGKESGIWFMLAAGLGVFRAQTNAAGEIMLSEDRIRNALDQSAGNHRELTRLLRIQLGQAWDDVLEPFRAARYQGNLALIHQAG
ncbi:MAG: DUF3145 family protein [Rhodoluna sp.]|jgi:hypothetical protein